MKQLTLMIVLLCTLLCTGCKQEAQPAEPPELVEPREKYNVGDQWVVEHVIYLSTIPGGSYSSDTILREEIPEGEVRVVTIKSTDFYNKGGGLTYVLIEYKGKTAYYPLRYLKMPKKKYDRLTEKYSDPDAPMPDYQKLLGKRYITDRGLKKLQHPVEITEIYDEQVPFFLWENNDLLAEEEYYKSRQSGSEYFISLAEIDFDPRHSFIILNHRLSETESQIVDVIPQNYTSKQLWLMSYLTNIIEYNGKISDEYLALIEYSRRTKKEEIRQIPAEKMNPAYINTLYKKPLRVWRLVKKKKGLAKLELLREDEYDSFRVRDYVVKSPYKRAAVTNYTATSRDQLEKEEEEVPDNQTEEIPTEPKKKKVRKFKVKKSKSGEITFVKPLSAGNAKKLKKGDTLYCWADGSRLRKEPDLSLEAVDNLVVGETVTYLGEVSKNKESAALRGVNYTEPFILVSKNNKQDKALWVYAPSMTEYDPVCDFTVTVISDIFDINKVERFKEIHSDGGEHIVLNEIRRRFNLNKPDHTGYLAKKSDEALMITLRETGSDFKSLLFYGMEQRPYGKVAAEINFNFSYDESLDFIARLEHKYKFRKEISDKKIIAYIDLFKDAKYNDSDDVCVFEMHDKFIFEDGKAVLKIYDGFTYCED